MERPEKFMDLFDVLSAYGRLDEPTGRNKTLAEIFWFSSTDLCANRRHGAPDVYRTQVDP